MSEARNHHYVSQFYLKGFARLRSKNEKLKVFDARRGTTFSTTPKNVATLRDFNRVDIEGVDPNVIEKRLSQFEGEADPAFARIIHAESIDNPDDFEIVMTVIALFLLRHPAFRSNIEATMTAMLERMTSLSLTKERWAEAEKELNQAGSEGHLDFDEARRRFEEGLFRVVPTKEFLIEQELGNLSRSVGLLRERNWTLIVAEGGAEFVTTDRPATLLWTQNTFERTPYSPGLALQNTTVLFPLSKRLLVTGSFEGSSNVYSADPRLVARYNAVIAATAANQVFCREDFMIADKFGNTMLFSRSPLWEAALAKSGANAEAHKATSKRGKGETA